MSSRNFYLLVYDITADRRRSKIARIMESIGDRVQYSVFEAYLTPKELKDILKRSQKVLEEEEDSLRVYFLCKDCREKVQTYGQGIITQPPDVMIV